MYYAIDINIMLDHDIDELKKKLRVSYKQIVITECSIGVLRKILGDAIEALRNERSKSKLINELLQRSRKLEEIREVFYILSDITSDDTVLNPIFRFFYTHFENLRGFLHSFFRDVLKIRGAQSKVHIASFVQRFISSLYYTDSQSIASKLISEVLRKYEEKGVRIIHSLPLKTIARKYGNFCEKLKECIDGEDCYQLLSLDLQDEVQDILFVTKDRALKENFDKYKEVFERNFGRQTKIRDIILLK